MLKLLNNLSWAGLTGLALFGVALKVAHHIWLES